MACVTCLLIAVPTGGAEEPAVLSSVSSHICGDEPTLGGFPKLEADRSHGGAGAFLISI